jgi:hypothetical protein
MCPLMFKFAIMRDLQMVIDVLHAGRVAQSVEQRIENPRVGSSILPPATSIDKGLAFS